MRVLIIDFLIFLNFIRCFPHLIVFLFHPKRKLIVSDIRRWLQILKKNYNITVGFIYLLGFFPEYRNLFYYRIGYWQYLLNICCRKMSSLIIEAKEIGEGLFINHGIATVIGGKSIGNNCTIDHQVTIGDNYGGRPTVLNNVMVHAGAIIVGNITIGNNAIIGANATVLMDVPDNSTVIPAQPSTMKWKNKSSRKD
jgi:serine O-acetyltransferase